MQLTKRALVLLLIAVLPLAMASVWPLAITLTSAYLVIMIGLLLADVAVSPKRTDFVVTRICDSKLSLAADNNIQLRLENRSPHSVSVTLRDEFPPSFQADRWQVTGLVKDGSDAVFTYHVKPFRRGDYRFGDINLRYRGVLGLVARQERYPSAAVIKVYPNLLDVRHYDLLARRGQLAEIGLRNVRVLGRGTEFERLRDYQSDDDYRRINWKATARRGRPVSVEYETERSQNIILMLDAGRLMASPVGRLAKLDYSVNTSLMLAYVATRMGDNVGLLAFADTVGVYLPPRRGRRQFLAMLESLYQLPAYQTEPDYDLAFRYLASHNRKRSLIVLFTDLIDIDTSRLLVSHISALSPHHLPVCVTIADPGITHLASAVPHDSQDVYQRAVAEDVLTERRRALEALRHRGSITLDLPADQLTASVVNKYLELKTRTRL